MANPRQRRKARSSSHRPVSHSRHAKKNLKKMPPIRGPKILQEAWDKTKTVRQNYMALGLIHDLNPCAAGGTERTGEEASEIEDSQMASTSQLEEQGRIRKGFGKIIRDEAGKVVGIEMGEEEDGEKKEDEEMKEVEVAGTVFGRWVSDLGGHEMGSGDTDVVQGLKRISSGVDMGGRTLGLSNGGEGRHVSSGERAYLGRLVAKHGGDVEGMARDSRLNTEQRTAGALRRALRKAGLAGW